MKARQVIGSFLVVILLSTTPPAAALPPLDPRLPTMTTATSATVADGMQIEVAGWIGGSVYAAAVQESYAYLGVGPVLVILDISNPAHPVVVGQSRMLPELVQGLAVAGNYVYVADGISGLRIMNVANPTAPREVGFYDTPNIARGVAVAGNYAYVTGLDPTLLILRFLLRDRVTTSILSSGGSLTSTSGDTSLVFPSGAFTATVTLTYRHLWTDQNVGPLAGIGRTFELSAVYSDTEQMANLSPGQSFSATLHYADAELGPAIESTLALYAWDGSQWVQEPSSVLDASANTLAATPNHLGLFAIFGDTHRVYLRVVMKRL